MLGTLQKMRVERHAPIHYFLRLGEEELLLNDFLGRPIQLKHLGEINCLNCKRKTKKSFNQGYCYPCFIKLAACDSCIIKPEKCHYHEGTCREPEWGEQHCMIPHIVYLANSSGLKVGITRKTQVPTRWIDQGATQAIPLFEVKSRYHSGLLETALKAHVADKTNWRKMLQGAAEALSMEAEREKFQTLAGPKAAELEASVLREESVKLEYPVLIYPEKVKSFNFDKDPLVQGTLQGIKGQYLILDQGVINLRKFGGYKVEFTG